MPFTFRQLEVFVEAAKDGNFRKTADRIGISQPSVSTQIRALEKDLNQTLFDRRRGHSAQLSSDGEALLEKAVAMLQERRALGHSPGGARDDAAAVLRVVFGPYILDHLIRPALPTFYEICPEVTLEFAAATSPRHMLELVREEKIDLAFYTGPRPSEQDSELEIIGQARCSIFGSPDLAARCASNPAAISDAPFVLPPEGASVTAWVLRALAAVAVTPRTVAARSPFPDVLAQMALAGKGLTVLYDEQVEAEVRSNRLVRIPLDLAQNYRVMIRGPAAHHPRAAPALAFFKERLLEKL